jgi:hypothetical protein
VTTEDLISACWLFRHERVSFGLTTSLGVHFDGDAQYAILLDLTASRSCVSAARGAVGVAGSGRIAGGSSSRQRHDLPFLVGLTATRPPACCPPFLQYQPKTSQQLVAIGPDEHRCRSPSASSAWWRTFTF